MRKRRFERGTRFGRCGGRRGFAHPAFALALGLLLTLAGCGARQSLHYRMTVEIETPQGVRAGSGVIEVRVRESAFFEPGSSVHFYVTGEAIPIDLPNGQTIYAVLADRSGPDYAHHLPHRVFSKRIPEMLGPVGSRASPTEKFEFLRSRKPSAVLELDEYPLLVRFADAADPRSIETLWLGESGELEPGIQIREIRIEITDDEITEGLRRRLPWLTALDRSLGYDGGLHPSNPGKDLTTRSFSEGVF